MAFVGFDVHGSRTQAAVLRPATGELSRARLRMASLEVLGFLEGLGGPVRAVYEAGPSGFVLAARARGVDVRVVAPGLIPRARGDRVKTDRRDAERLVGLLAAGELWFSYVPSEADEQFRDLVGGIEDNRGDLMRARHRLWKLLRRRALRYPGPGASWTQAHWAWLRALRVDDACTQAVFGDHLAGIELLLARRSSLVATLEQQIPCCSHAETIARLRCLGGIDTLVGAGVCADVGDWQPFPRPTHVSGFFGIVPSEHTFDSKPAGRDHQGRPRPTPADCSSRPPGTTVTVPRSAPCSRAAKKPRTRA